MSETNHLRALVEGPIILLVMLAGAFGIIALFVGIPSYFFGEAGAVGGAVVLTILGWGYIMGLFAQL